MSFSTRKKASGTFENRTVSFLLKTVGDMTEQDFIDLLGFTPDFETVIPNVVGGDKTFGDLTFEDKIRVLAHLLWDTKPRQGGMDD